MPDVTQVSYVAQRIMPNFLNSLLALDLKMLTAGAVGCVGVWRAPAVDLFGSRDCFQPTKAVREKSFLSRYHQLCVPGVSTTSSLRPPLHFLWHGLRYQTRQLRHFGHAPCTCGCNEGGTATFTDRSCVLTTTSRALGVLCTGVLLEGLSCTSSIQVTPPVLPEPFVLTTKTHVNMAYKAGTHNFPSFWATSPTLLSL
jgi:hypothetical protein